MSNLLVIQKKIKNEKIYLFNTACSSVSGLCEIVIMLFLWGAIYTNGGNIENLNYKQIITYYLSIFIVTFLIRADNIARDISMDIKFGTINNYIIKPTSYLNYMLCKHIGENLFRALTMIIPISIFCCILKNNLFFYVERLAQFIVTLIISFVLNYLIYYLIGILSFWFMENGGIIQLWHNMLGIVSGEKIPLFLFPVTLQKAFVFLPFKYTIYYPASILSENDVDYQGLIIAIVWIIILRFVILIVWHKGCKKHEGVGI